MNSHLQVELTGRLDGGDDDWHCHIDPTTQYMTELLELPISISGYVRVPRHKLLKQEYRDRAAQQLRTHINAAVGHAAEEWQKLWS